MNVLLTSSGRRTYLVDFFREALNGKGLVFASNSMMSPALKKADGYGISPLIYSGEYIPWVLDFCETHEIGLVVPLFDIDLPVLAKNRKKFEKAGIKLAVSGLETARTAADKQAMCKVLAAAGIGAAKSVTNVNDALAQIGQGSLAWPLFIKPRFGMGSIGLFEADNEEELKVLFAKCEKRVRESYLKYESSACPEEAVLIQEKLAGNEYGLDVICNLDGRYQTTVVRRKLAMRSGETDEALVLGADDPEYETLCKLGKQLSQIFDIRGNMDVDVLMEANGKADASGIKPYVIDINARFGGGYPFSHLAGVDLPRAYIAWANGEQADPAWLTAKAGVHGYKDIYLKQY